MKIRKEGKERDVAGQDMRQKRQALKKKIKRMLLREEKIERKNRRAALSKDEICKTQ